MNGGFQLPPELIATYLANRKTELTELQELVASLDWMELRQRGHRLKGNGPAYGYAILGEIGKDLMLAAESQDQTAVTSALARYEAWLVETLNNTGLSGS